MDDLDMRQEAQQDYEDGARGSFDENPDWENLGRAVDYAIDAQHRGFEDSAPWDDPYITATQTAISDTVRGALDGWLDSGEEGESESEMDSGYETDSADESESETDSGEEPEGDAGGEDDAGGGCVIS